MFVLLFLSLAHAQVRLAPIEVQAPGPLLQQVSTPTWRASEVSLQESGDLQQVLQQAPGVVGTQSGGFGGQGSFFLRGSEARHTVVLTEGMRLNDPSGTDRGFDSAFFLTPFFRDLILLQGPAPVLYGGDATSGVIELIPRRGNSPREATLGLSYGSFDTRQGFGLIDWGGGNHQGTFGVIHLKTEGFSRLSKRRFGATEKDGAETTQVMQASHHRWNEKLSTDLFFYGVTGIAETDDSTIGDTNDKTRNLQGTLVQTTRGQFARGDWWLKTGVVSSDRELTLESYGDLNYQGQTRDARGGIRLQHGQFETLAGLGGEQEWMSTDDFKAHNDVGHLFALERWRHQDWLVELGGRSEHHQRYGSFFAHEMSLSKNWQDEWHTYAKQARGYKSPSLFQLYAPASFGGNPELAPEKNISTEVGISWKRAGEVSAVVFQQDFQNLIQYAATPNRYFNSGGLRVQGLETNVISPEHFWGQVKLSWTFLDYSKYDETPLKRPPYVGTLGWLAFWGRWTTEVNARALGGRKDFGNHKMAAYELLSAAIKFAPSANQQWSLRLGNLTDREYEDVWGYTVAPLNATLQWIGRY